MAQQLWRLLFYGTLNYASPQSLHNFYLVGSLSWVSNFSTNQCILIGHCLIPVDHWIWIIYLIRRSVGHAFDIFNILGLMCPPDKGGNEKTQRNAKIIEQNIEVGFFYGFSAGLEPVLSYNFHCNIRGKLSMIRCKDGD